ncbi:MAG TPA: 50S ribosomal protein L25 [Bacillota bacterium]|nr:50S ribosomal protein L25 [Bacillota bacterium]
MSAILKTDFRGNRRSTLTSLRNHGRIPAVLYGENGPNESIHVDRGEFSQAIREHGKGGIFELHTPDGSKVNAMIYEIQKNQLKNSILHIDFKRINMNKPIQTIVPIALIGHAQGGGIIQFQTRELEIRCLPHDIPENIPVYASELEIGDSLTVRDIELPAGVEVQHEQDEVILSVVAPRLDPVEIEEEVHEPEVVGAVDGPGLDEAK